MPGLLPFIQVGSESELGRAVADLTGLGELVDLANHSERVRKRVEGEQSKLRRTEIEDADKAYNRARADVEATLAKHP